MEIKIDKEANALYIKFYNKNDSPRIITEPEDPFVISDYTEDGELYGIEILGLENINIESIEKFLKNKD